MSTTKVRPGTWTGSDPGHWRGWLRFFLHLLEMVVAMYLGMRLLGIPYGAVMSALGYSHPYSQFPELSALVMVFNMTVPMVALMLLYRHGWERSAEMAAAMFLPAVMLVVLCVLGVIPHGSLMRSVMTPMIPAMLAVMLFRRADYLSAGRHGPATQKPATSHPAPA